MGAQVPPFGIIAVNHVMMGQICSRGFGMRLPHGSTSAFRLLDSASCPSLVPAKLLAPANIIVWVDLVKARSLGYLLTSDQPGHSLLSGRRRWISCNMVSFALPPEQV
jgi:hypothetical protein